MAKSNKAKRAPKTPARKARTVKRAKVRVAKYARGAWQTSGKTARVMHPHAVLVRLSDEENEFVKLGAVNLGVSLASYVRTVIRDAKRRYELLITPTKGKAAKR